MGGATTDRLVCTSRPRSAGGVADGAFHADAFDRWFRLVPAIAPGNLLRTHGRCAAATLRTARRGAILRREVPFGWRAATWESGLVTHLNDEFLAFNPIEFVPGDLAATQNHNGAVCQPIFFLELERTRTPVALELALRSLAGPGVDTAIFGEVFAVPLERDEVVLLAAICALRVTPAEVSEIQRSDPGSIWVHVREIARPSGADLIVRTRRDGQPSISIERRLSLSELTYTVNRGDPDSFAYPLRQVEGFAKLLVEINHELRYGSPAASRSGSGCFVATAVYGAYDEPQVRVLRRWRDETLRSTRTGEALVRAYYATSPLLVRHLGTSRWFISPVRVVLDLIVTRLSKTGVDDGPYCDRPTGCWRPPLISVVPYNEADPGKSGQQ